MTIEHNQQPLEEPIEVGESTEFNAKFKNAFLRQDIEVLEDQKVKLTGLVNRARESAANEEIDVDGAMLPREIAQVAYEDRLDFIVNLIEERKGQGKKYNVA